MARGFGATFGTGTTDKMFGGTNISVGSTLSISAWINRNGNGGSGFGTIFCVDTSGAKYLDLFTISTSQIVFERDWTNAPSWTAGGSPANSVWQHVAVTYDGTVQGNKPLIYINGSAQAVTTATSASGSLATINSVPRIGNDSSSTLNWDGSVAEVGFWNSTILTANEVLALSRGAAPFNVRWPALSFYCPCLGVQASDPDWGVNHQTVTTTGAKYQNHPPVKELKSLMTGT